jgi:signal transduction histidine kinase
MRPDEEMVPVEITTSPIGDDLALLIARDITERLVAELELRDVNDRLVRLQRTLRDEVTARTRELAAALGQRTAVLTNLTDGLVALLPTLEVDVVNPALVRMLGLPEVDLIGQPAHRLLPPQLIAAAERSMRDDRICQTELALPSGIALAAASPIRATTPDGASTCHGSVLVVRDVTLEREVDRMKSDFIATVSHELRTPLTSVLGFAKLARSRLEGSVFPHVPEDDRAANRAVRQVRRNLDIIGSEGQRLTALIDDVLDISKLESGRVDWNMQPVSPADLLAEANAASASLFTPGVVFAASSADHLPPLYGDRHRLVQVLVNLVSNAAKFTTAGTVAMEARLVPEGLELSVSDTGVGIAADQLDRVFERLQQLGDTLTDKPAGTGLGLAICRQIVVHHGGRIWVDSELGEGSRFAFIIPLA